MFDQEKTHADRTWADKGFQTAYRCLCSKHQSAIKTLRAENASTPLWADFSFLDRNPEQDLKDENDDFQFDLALLCAKYNLAGISQKKPHVIPQKLCFAYDPANVIIRVPRYLKVDLNRTLPLDVIKLLLVREHLLYFKPPLAKPPKLLQQWFHKVPHKN